MQPVQGQDQKDAEVGGDDGALERAHPWGSLSLPLCCALGAAMEIGFIAMRAASPRPGSTARFFVSFFAVFALYALAARAALSTGRPPAAPAALRASRVVSGAILLAACLFRITLLPSAPALSDDLYRYRWDGRVLLSGGNPYLLPPAASSPGSALRDRYFEPIAHKEVGTIYPPAAQLLFAAGAFLSPGVLGLKLLLVLCDLLVIACLLGILAERRLPPARVLLYAWNPLAVIEVAWNGHVEPLGVLLALVAALAIIQRRDLRASTVLALAGLVKLLPLALFAPFIRSMRLRALALAPVVLAAACWPFRGAGRRLFDGLGAYARRWVANESIFGIVEAGIAWLDPTPALKGTIAWLRVRIPWTGPLDRLYPWLYPPDLARAACAAAALGIAVAVVRLRIEPLRGAYVLTGALLLLSPVLHPWYLLWILPWVCLFPSRAWLLLSGLVVLAYANLGAAGREAEPYPWIRFLEYLPFYALLLWETLDARRRPSAAR